MVKKFEDMLSRFDTIHNVTDGQTRTTACIGRAMHSFALQNGSVDNGSSRM